MTLIQAGGYAVALLAIGGLAVFVGEPVKERVVKYDGYEIQIASNEESDTQQQETLDRVGLAVEALAKIHTDIKDQEDRDEKRCASGRDREWCIDHDFHVPE